jgi:hypothetical protein
MDLSSSFFRKSPSHWCNGTEHTCHLVVDVTLVRQNETRFLFTDEINNHRVSNESKMSWPCMSRAVEEHEIDRFQRMSDRSADDMYRNVDTKHYLTTVNKPTDELMDKKWMMMMRTVAMLNDSSYTFGNRANVGAMTSKSVHR